MNLLCRCMGRVEKTQLRCAETRYSILRASYQLPQSLGKVLAQAAFQESILLSWCYTSQSMAGTPWVLVEELRRPVEAGVGDRAEMFLL